MYSSRKRGITLSKEKVDKVRLALEHSKVILDMGSKGLAVEKNEKEKIKATLLKDEIVQFILDTKKFERREEIKTIPNGVLRIAITAILNIEDSRSINNKINYLRTYNQIDDIIGTKQYRLNL